MTDLLADLPAPLPEQIAELERELKMREHAYPRFIEKGTLTQRRADQRVRAMKAAVGKSLVSLMAPSLLPVSVRR